MVTAIKSEVWEQALLTYSGQPLMEENEHEIFIQSNVGLYIDDHKLTNYHSGRVYLTNHRIVYVNNDQKISPIFIKVVSIESVEFYNGFLKSSPKVIIKIKTSETADVRNKKQNMILSWVCTICYFTNDLKTSNYELERMSEDFNILPTCVNCGVKSSWKNLKTVLKDRTMEPNIDLLSYDGTYCPDCTFLNHSTMLNCEICGAILKKVGNSNSDNDSVKFIIENGKDMDYLNLNLFKLSFRDGGAKSFFKNLQETIKTALWDHIEDSNGINKGAVRIQQAYLEEDDNTKLNKIIRNKPINLRGIHGLTTRSEKNSTEASLLLNNSIQDLEQLISKAKQLIEFSQKYNIILKKSHISPSTTDNSLATILQSKAKIIKLNDILQVQQISQNVMNFKKINSLSNLKMEGKPTLGTKSKCPLFYLEELSRHLSEFLITFNILEKNDGLITLQEFYLLYNKARKINLLSPEELYDSVFLFEKLQLNFTVTNVPLYPNDKDVKDNEKIIVISKNNQSTSISMKLLAFLTINPGKSILQLQNTSFNMSYMILKTILDKLVYTNELVIDSTLEGILYWPNDIIKFR